MPAHIDLIILVDAGILRFIKCRRLGRLSLCVIQCLIGYPTDITILCSYIAPIIIGFKKHHLLSLGCLSEYFTLDTALITDCCILLQCYNLLFCPLCSHHNTVRLSILGIIHLRMCLHIICSHIAAVIVSTHDHVTLIRITAAIPCLHSIFLLIRGYHHHFCRRCKQQQLLIVIPIKTTVDGFCDQSHTQINSAVNGNSLVFLQYFLIQRDGIFILR